MDNSLKILSELSTAHLKKKHPNFPEHALPKQKYSDKTANGLTKCIIDFINLNGGMAERINNTGRYLQGETVTNVIGISRTFKGKYIPGTGTNGTADISGTLNSKSIKVEVKIGKDSMSQMQKDYRDKVIAAGGFYFIAKDFESFYNWIKEVMKKEDAL
jgi:hypothetical protein